MSTTKVSTAMMASDMATQAELDAINTALDARLDTLEGAVTGKLVGDVVQVVSTQSGTYASGSTVIPGDNTIPQNTEGDEYITRSITPTNANNKLLIEVVLIASNSGANQSMIAALFQDTTANALAAGMQVLGGANTVGIVRFSHYMTAGTTSATTFKVRAGATSAGTTYFNGASAAGLLGGVLASSITITEIKA